MTTITTRNDLRDYLDAHLPFLREEGRLDEAVDALRDDVRAPEWGSDWGAYLSKKLGGDGNWIYDLIGRLKDVTDEQIRDLETEAGQAGDEAMVAICRRARDVAEDEEAWLLSVAAARAECARVIAAARATETNR